MANDPFSLSCHCHFSNFLKNPSEHFCFTLAWANLMLLTKISRWSQRSVAWGRSGSRLMWASFYFVRSTLPWNAYPCLHPVQSIQIEIINASWLLTHFFRRLDTYWEAWSLLRFPQTPGSLTIEYDTTWNCPKISTSSKRKISKNVSTDVQDIQKYIHGCARYAMQRPNSGSIRCKEQFSINPRAERLELGNIYSFDANDVEQYKNREID